MFTSNKVTDQLIGPNRNTSERREKIRVTWSNVASSAILKLLSRRLEGSFLKGHALRGPRHNVSAGRSDKPTLWQSPTPSMLGKVRYALLLTGFADRTRTMPDTGFDSGRNPKTPKVFQHTPVRVKLWRAIKHRSTEFNMLLCALWQCLTPSLY